VEQEISAAVVHDPAKNQPHLYKHQIQKSSIANSTTKISLSCNKTSILEASNLTFKMAEFKTVFAKDAAPRKFQSHPSL
jgi:hypothetical protein